VLSTGCACLAQSAGKSAGVLSKAGGGTGDNDRTVKLDGRLFEAPAGLVGMKVVLRFENYDRIEVFLDDTSKGFLRDLNQEVNSRIKRENTDPVSPQATGGALFEKLNTKAGT